MKKSNKLLLGGFLTVILLIAGIHIALYAKYKSGDYTLVKPQRLEPRPEAEMQYFQDISVVRIRIVYFTNAYFRDSASVEKSSDKLIRYEQKGDSLLITGHYYGKAQEEGRNRITITLPYNATIVTDSISQVSLQVQDFIKQKVKIVP